MKNLENLDLVELSALETVEILGGSFWEDVSYVVGYVAGQTVHAYNTLMSQPSSRPTSWIHK